MATAEQNRESDYMSRMREGARQLWAGYLILKGGQPEYNAQDYGTTLDVGVGANEGITKTQIGAVVFDTANALTTLFDTGHATNLTDVL